jgi:hypothetical protein
MQIPEYRFPDSSKIAKPLIAKSEDAPQIANFWNKYYSEEDWRFKCTFEEIVKWMEQGFIILIRNNNKDEIISTFAFRKIKGGVICGIPNSQAAIVDGLVVKPEFRKTGLASYMMACIDKFSSELHDFPQGFLIWFREQLTPINNVLQTPIAILKYSYLNLDTLKQTEENAKKATPEFVKKIVNRVYNHDPSKFTLASLSTTDSGVLWFSTMGALIGIADTHRVSIYEQPIWEIVFAANEHIPFFMNLQNAIESAAYSLPCKNGLLFLSNGISRGNMSNPTGNWVCGRSGYLTAHVFNWMPPTFLTGDILFPHSCI